MKRSLTALLCLAIILLCGGCGSSSGSSSTAGIVVNVSGSFATIAVGGAPVTLMASVSGTSGNRGVTWNLSVANTSCSPACGTLQGTSSSAVYTPPSTLPLNQTATITARSLADNSQIFAFNFQIVPPIAVSITTKFSAQTAGGPVTDLSATINNDVTGAGLSWTLTAGGASCSPACGTLTVDPAPSLTAHYQPPATPPTGANASPTITATSVADSTKNDSFSFTIVAPPIAVTIVNKTSTQAVAGPAYTVNVSLANDFTNAGVSWSLTAAGAACVPATACGTLVPSPAPSLSAVYTPPTTLPTGANASPTITATSVADPTKSDSFTFSIVAPASLFKGNYALLFRGYNSAGAPLAVAGSIITDGLGSITGGELDLNVNGTLTSIPAPLAGSYTLDASFNSIPRITISLTVPTSIVPSGTLVLKCVLSSDGARGKLIEFDGSFSLNAGTLLQQDPTALAAANPAGSYAFGVDSDAGQNAGITGRIVEAGQFILGAGGTSVTGGVADASQATAPAALFGGPSAPAPLDGPAASATAPDALGRGTLTLSFAGNVTHYAYYIVSVQQLNLIEIDTGGAFHSVQAGTARLQQTLSVNTVTATSVAALTGATTVSGVVGTDVIIGVLSVTGNVPSVHFDSNAAGTFVANISGPGTIFSPFDPTTGRTVLVNTFFVAAAVYYYDIGKGFVIDVTPFPNGINHAFSGPLLPQTAPPFSVQNDLSGNSIAIGGASSTSSIPNFEMAANFNGVSSYSAVADLATSNSALGANGQVPNIPLSGGYRIDDTTVGRGEIQIIGGLLGDPVPAETDLASFYLIGPNQFVAIGETSGLSSGILFFDPQ